MTRVRVQFEVYAYLSGLLIIIVACMVASWLMTALDIASAGQMVVCAVIGCAGQLMWQHKVIRPLRKKTEPFEKLRERV